MAIPKIATYEMPKAADFPKNKTDWAFNPDRAVLLIHDMQDYFLDFFAADDPLIQLLFGNIKKVQGFARASNMPIVYTAQPINQKEEVRGLLNDMWGRGIDNRPERKEIVKALLPQAKDIVLEKWRYSAFQLSNFDKMMADKGRDQLVICGVYGHIGCLMTAANAFMLNIKAFLVGDAIADFSLAEHRMALQYVATRCGQVIGCDALIKKAT